MIPHKDNKDPLQIQINRLFLELAQMSVGEAALPELKVQSMVQAENKV